MPDKDDGRLSVMEKSGAKKLAIVRIYQILKEHSDQEHPITQTEIAEYLESEYGLYMERKAIGRNIALLKEAGLGINSVKDGSYLEDRVFEDAELHLLIDGILCSKHIAVAHSKTMIKKLCDMSSEHFKSSSNYIYTVNDRGKTDNYEVFYTIEVIDAAIEQGKQVLYQYNKYGVDKKLHKSSRQCVTPYLMILNNQRYYLMGYSDKWERMTFQRIDRMTNIEITEDKAKRINDVPGYENGIDIKELTTALPYMYGDKHEQIVMLADIDIVDQVVDWFGKDIVISNCKDDPQKVKVALTASPNAMEHWALQYIHFVEVLSPESLRSRIKDALGIGLDKYK